jgi:putative membrane protein (TIGR04086 family)
MSKLSIKGVLVGGITDIGATFVLGIPLGIYVVSKLDLAHIPQDKLAAAVSAAMHASVPIYVGQMVIGLGSSMLGGYVAGRLAKHHELLNGAFSSFLCIAVGIYSVFLGKDSHSLLEQVLLFLASPALGLLGGYFSLMQRRSRKPVLTTV